MTVLESIQEIRLNALEKLNVSTTEAEMEELNTTILGRNGALTGVLKGLGKLGKEERAQVGAEANRIKKEVEEAIGLRRAALAKKARELRFAEEAIDVTEPGKHTHPSGRLHPMTQTYRLIRDALVGMGFQLFDGPEIELDDYNFTMLNLPKDHPARDMQDTFYINENVVLRTHTSPCEIRSLLNVKPPFRFVMPGRVFRVDEVDASHSPVFMQMEGFIVDKGLTLADLKGTLETFIQAVFGSNVKIRMRPSYFPFTEPSAEVDMSCTICGGKGCRACKGTGWIEILGCGITNPHEILNCGYDPNEWSALAFGIGVDRVASLKYGISDIRHQYENDARFLRQF